MNFEVQEIERCVHVVSQDYSGKNWEQWYLIGADYHWDNPKCDRALLKRHLEQARERNAGIFCFGDFFCAMQGKYDKRSSKSSVRPEHQTNTYLDSLVSTSVDWFKPYAENMVLVSPGNHETAIEKRHETDLIERFVSGMNLKHSPQMPVYMGGYGGWIVFHFSRNGGGVRKIRLKYFHGSGGGGPVTKGVIGTNRRAVYLPDADIVITGHVHESWSVELVQERLQKNNNRYLHAQYHIQTPTYKEEYLTKSGKGWHVERGAPPKPLGGYWLRFYSTRTGVDFDIIRAK